MKAAHCLLPQVTIILYYCKLFTAQGAGLYVNGPLYNPQYGTGGPPISSDTDYAVCMVGDA